MKDFALWVSARTGGLKLVPRDWRAALVAALACVAGVTLWSVLLNSVIFKGALPTGYRDYFTAPLWPRMALVAAQALTEELVYRLVLMTGLVMLGVRLFGRLTVPWAILSIATAQWACIWPFVIAVPVYGSLYFWLNGCIWGWLYWRHGWMTAALAHCSIHLVLDPLLYWLL